MVLVAAIMISFYLNKKTHEKGMMDLMRFQYFEASNSIKSYIKSNMPEEIKYANAALSFDQLIRSLDVGQAFVSNTETDRAFVMDVRPRISVHGGF